MVDEPSPYAVLADILTSKRIGIAHVRLVGEVLIADSSLNRWLSESGKKSLSKDAWVDLTERVLECEARYEAAWADLVAAETVSARNDALRHLEDELRHTVSVFTGLREELPRHG